MAAKVITKKMVEGLGYDPLLGNIYRTKDMKRWKAGSIVGTPDKDGYLTFKRQRSGHFKNHRVAFTLMGEPLKEHEKVDHINGDVTDNSWDNLRRCTQRDNTNNKTIHRNGKLVGTTRNKNGTYSGYIHLKGKSYNLGTFKTELEAHKAYMAARKVG